MPHIRHTATLLDEFGEAEHTVVAYEETPFFTDEGGWTLPRASWARRQHLKWLDTVLTSEWDIVDD